MRRRCFRNVQETFSGQGSDVAELVQVRVVVSQGLQGMIASFSNIVTARLDAKQIQGSSKTSNTSKSIHNNEVICWPNCPPLFGNAKPFLPKAC